jgi:acetylornithine deacetylase/succinyl-diaminopimelate desuccinylase-like protein
MRAKTLLLGTIVLAQAAAAQAPAAPAPALTADQAAFRSLYKELVETNTTLSSGSCTLAAERMAARLRAAGYADSDITLFSTPDHPKEGGLVAILRGTDPAARPMLLLAHIDVVEAKREDWTRDPFTLVEENGYFYARGASDDKAMASIWVDNLIRYRKEGFRPKRSIKLALTCGEETTYAFNGAEYLSKNRRDLIDAAFALNEGGGGRLDANGRPEVLSLQVGEKAAQNYTLETTNPGGHSSIPRPDNAIYDLANALTRLSAYEFPIQFTETTRSFFGRVATLRGGEVGGAVRSLLANPADMRANAIVSSDPVFHSMLRTTCVATLLEGGHANNALPQRARANVNCRIFPGNTVEATRAALVQAIGNPKVTVTPVPPVRPIAAPPPLDPKIVGPAEQLAKEMFPGIPVLPTMSTGATDAVFLSTARIPTYGVPGILGEGSGSGVHGLNEHISVNWLYRGRDYLYRLVKIYANQS